MVFLLLHKSAVMKSLNILLLHNSVPADASKDELDTLEQAAEVSQILRDMGHRVTLHHYPGSEGGDPQILLKTAQADLVFNLVEECRGQVELNYLLPLMMQYHGRPFTGAGFEALALSTDKLLSKRLMAGSDIPTAPWVSLNPIDEGRADKSALYLLKPVHGDASQGIYEDNIILHPFGTALSDLLKSRQEQSGKAWFAEAYIEGREFNVSMLEKDGKVEVLHPAEIIFSGYPAEKLKIVGYKAKWEVHSFEYQNTPRTFEFSAEDRPLLQRLKHLASLCWELFALSGYARADFRVDRQGKPYLLEINANPCLGPENGFASAAAYSGIKYQELLTHIIGAALKRLD